MTVVATIRFDVRTEFDASPRALWDELIDWKGHEAWIPATRVVIDSSAPGDHSAVGDTFTAFTGYRSIALEDRMRVERCEWDAASRSGRCTVEKLGPVLRGRAGFTVEPRAAGSVMVWTEDVTVARIPQFLAPVIARLSALGFKLGMRKLAAVLSETTPDA